MNIERLTEHIVNNLFIDAEQRCLLDDVDEKLKDEIKKSWFNIIENELNMIEEYDHK